MQFIKNKMSKVWILEQKELRLTMTENQNIDFRDYCKKNPKAKFRLEPIESHRTSTQNNALHLWFEMLAKELNDSGNTVQLVLKQKVELEWTKDIVKELLWRPAQKVILKKDSTTELKKLEDMDKVWEHLNRHIGEKFGIHIPFPVDEEKQRESIKGY